MKVFEFEMYLIFELDQFYFEDLVYLNDLFLILLQQDSNLMVGPSWKNYHLHADVHYHFLFDHSLQEKYYYWYFQTLKNCHLFATPLLNKELFSFITVTVPIVNSVFLLWVLESNLFLMQPYHRVTLLK